jgi:hypothetical protein
MLQCIMTNPIDIQLALEDLLADLQHARRCNELGRLALLAYCEIRNWARQAGKMDIADNATKMFTEDPCVNKDEFLAKVDHLITSLEQQRQEQSRNTSQYAAAKTVAMQSFL